MRPETTRMITEIEQNRTERLRKMELRIEKAGLSARKPKKRDRTPQKATDSACTDEIPLRVFLIDCFFPKGGGV